MSQQIYKATYSGVPVYEMDCNGVAVMRRRVDSYLNATQILKVAQFDKPQRTRILEKEVQIGQHEKVQGGYGKYQGTWVPFERGVSLAEHYHVDSILRPIFDFVKGDESPPLAPKHVTAASTRPRKPKTTEPKRKKVITKPVDYEPMEFSLTDNSTSNHKKRPRNILEGIEYYDDRQEDELYEEEDEVEDEENMTQDRKYAQKLLQYFISDDNGIPSILLRPPNDLDVNVIIDDEGHTSLHWAAAMGRLKLVNILIELGADVFRVNYKGQTALMRSVLFTNNFDQKSFLFLIEMLKNTIFNIDKKDQTVFHHVSSTASWKGKVHASRYYMECLIETLSQNQSELISILNVQDVYGDTALSIAARIGNKKLVRLLIDAGASSEIANEEGMTAQDYLSEVEKHNRYQPQESNQVIDHKLELASRTRLRTTVETLFKKIIINDRAQPPVVSQIFDGFAGNYERELIQKDNLIKEKRNELELTRKRLMGTNHTYEQIQFDPVKLDSIQQEAAHLTSLLKKQSLLIQKESIAYDISQQQADSSEEATVEKARELQRQLKSLQQSRKQSTAELEHKRLQTPSKRHQEYKRLISMCCNVAYENVDLMLVPLLASFDELVVPPSAFHQPTRHS